MIEEAVYVGVDVAKGALDVAVTDSGETWQFVNDNEGVSQVVFDQRRCNYKFFSGVESYFTKFMEIPEPFVIILIQVFRIFRIVLAPATEEKVEVSGIEVFNNSDQPFFTYSYPLMFSIVIMTSLADFCCTTIALINT